MDEAQFFWGGWESMARIVVVGTLGYLWLLSLVRLTGQRTLSTMTAFDFLITVTLGSAFGRILTAREVAVSDMLVAFVLLVALQWGLAVLRHGNGRLAPLVDLTPTLLYHGGAPVQAALQRHRVSPSHLQSAARMAGHGSLDDVAVIVLEVDGSLSVIGGEQAGDGSCYRDLLD
jgi:uncharacterized membrane protein YcaP (DUF421 family)